MNIPARTSLAGICLAATGGVLFMIGLGAAFGRAGNWSNHVAELGMFLMALGALSNVLAFFSGMRSFVQRKRVEWWWLLSAIATLGCLYAVWVLLHL